MPYRARFIGISASQGRGASPLVAQHAGAPGAPDLTLFSTFVGAWHRLCLLTRP